MEYMIHFQWDDEAAVWVAENDIVPIVLEDASLDRLMERVKLAIPELLELNGLPPVKFLYYFVDHREEVFA